MLEQARLPTCKIYALDSAFETKDVLKARGYRWAGVRKVWTRELKASNKVAEFEWLKQIIYGESTAALEIETLTARTRYSERAGITEKVMI